MRSTLFTLAALIAASPAAAQEQRFTKEMAAGSKLQVENINGSIDVTQASGRTAEIVVTKTVKKGDGNMVKAIMEEEAGVVRVCTIYLNREPNRTTCKGTNSDGPGRGKGESLEVDMHYVVRVPAGVHLGVDAVNGNVSVTGVDNAVKIATVNGDVVFEGASASSLETVNGKIKASLSKGTWTGTMHVETVNGGIELSFPATLSADISGSSVNGGISSPDFPVTIEGKWGPKSFSGKIGGGGAKLTLETVNGGITLRKR